MWLSPLFNPILPAPLPACICHLLERCAHRAAPGEPSTRPCAGGRVLRGGTSCAPPQGGHVGGRHVGAWDPCPGPAVGCGGVPCPPCERVGAGPALPQPGTPAPPRRLQPQLRGPPARAAQEAAGASHHQRAAAPQAQGLDAGGPGRGRRGLGWWAGLGCHTRPGATPALRPQIIDPFVEVEVIGLPVDCNKEQTRVVDDNGEAWGPQGRAAGGGSPCDPSSRPAAPYRSLCHSLVPRFPGPGGQPQRRHQKRVWAQVACGLDLRWEVTPPPGGL